MRPASGDTSQRWRDSYTRVRKDLFRNDVSTNRARLTKLGVDRLPRDSLLLDLGAGDGNLMRTLEGAGFTRCFGFEFQPALVVGCSHSRRVAIASATDIPFRSGMFVGVIVMDVLHHLTVKQLPRCIDEIRRVLRPSGLLFVCEPTNSLLRRILTRLLFGPAGNFSQFTRDKRTMVEEERATLEPWLASEHTLSSRLQAFGFRREFFKRCWLHHYGRFLNGLAETQDRIGHTSHPQARGFVSQI